MLVNCGLLYTQRDYCNRPDLRIHCSLSLKPILPPNWSTILISPNRYFHTTNTDLSSSNFLFIHGSTLLVGCPTGPAACCTQISIFSPLLGSNFVIQRAINTREQSATIWIACNLVSRTPHIAQCVCDDTYIAIQYPVQNNNTDPNKQ